MSESKEFCTIYIVRHGETDHNLNGIIQGQTDVALNPKGTEQASLAGQKLRNVKFDAVYASDLTRAKRTAEIIIAEKQVAVNTTQLLRERHYGQYEDRAHKAFQAENEALLLKLEAITEEQRRNFKFDVKYESDNEVASRVITFLRELAVTYAGKTILVVSHGGVMRILLAHLGFKSREEMKHIFIENTGYLKLESDGVEFNLLETSGLTIK